MKLRIYIISYEPISTACFINGSHQCLYAYVARQRLGINVNAATNTQATIREFFHASFSIRSVSYRRRVCGSVVYPPVVARQRLVKSVPVATNNCWRSRVLCGRIVSMESRRLVLPRNSCLNFVSTETGNLLL
jgi:hypothetical protein